MKNITVVTKDKLCHGCGICKSICPANAIEIVFDKLAGQFLPKVDEAKCTDCGLCLQVCSGLEVDQVELAKDRAVADDHILGFLEAVFISSSEDEEICKNGASGGSVTTILSNLFQQKAIDAAIIANTEISEVSKNSAILIEQVDDLMKNQSSNYTNIPLLKDISDYISQYDRLAIVALPCQVHSLKKALKINPNWQQKKIFIIGLLCGGVYRQQALQRHIESLKYHPNNIKSVKFRQGKWPGEMRITTSKEKQLFSKRGKYFLTNYLRRCYFCNDFLNEFADISVGDNWLKHNGNGENIIIIRDNKITPYLENLKLEEIEPNNLYRAYRLDQRRNKYFAANSLMGKIWGWKVPKIKVTPTIKPKFHNYYISLADSIQFKLGNSGDRVLKIFFLLKNGIHHHCIKKGGPANHSEDSKKNKKIKTILISEADVVGNKGAVAMLEMLMKLLSENLGEVNFIVTSMHRNSHPTNPNIKVINTNGQSFDLALAKAWAWWLGRQMGIKCNFLLNDKILQQYLKADLILSASGISFNEDFGMIQQYHYSKYVQIPLFLEKPVIKFTQTIGPFESSYNRNLAKKLLPNLSHIFARGKLTAQNLKKIGIVDNVKIFPDIALTLQPDRTERISKIIEIHAGSKIVGISPNIVCKRLETKENYVPSLIYLCEKILENYPDVKILLLPHTIAPESAGDNDDLSICQTISQQLDDERVILESTLDFSPAEAKALIASCDFFIGSRFHSIIAAVSALVPTISIGWHWKYRETMQWLEMEEKLLQYWDLTPSRLWDLFQQNYSKRNELHQHLENKIPELKMKALEAIELICEELK